MPSSLHAHSPFTRLRWRKSFGLKRTAWNKQLAILVRVVIGCDDLFLRWSLAQIRLVTIRAQPIESRSGVAAVGKLNQGDCVTALSRCRANTSNSF